MEEKLSDEQLSQWIAENVFGLCWHKQSLFIFDCEKCGKPIKPNSYYCNSISEAWKVVEALKAKKCAFELITPVTKSGKYGAKIIKFGSVIHARNDVKAYADSMPRAICEAGKNILEKK